MTRANVFADVPNTAATYYLLNHANHRIYVGTTANLRSRFRSHLSTLCNDNHTNGALQADWNMYGRAAFEFGVLVEGCYPFDGRDHEGYSSEKRESFEDIFIRVYQSDNPEYGYNIGHFEGRAGLAFTHLTKVKRLAAHWKIGNRRRHDTETIRRCIDYTYSQLFGDQP